MPDDLADHQLVVRCGACMWNRRQMLSRLLRRRRLGVPVTNYGMAITYTQGLFRRALAPFPEVRRAGGLLDCPQRFPQIP